MFSKNGITSEDGVDSIPRYADRLDVVLMTLGLVGAAVNGATLPMFFVIFGAVCLYFIYLAIVVVSLRKTTVAQFHGIIWGEIGLWMWTGVRQANKIRHAHLAAVLQQEVAFFDVETSSGNLLNSLNEDTLTIQNAIGGKVGNFVHHTSAYVVGLAIGVLLHCVLGLWGCQCTTGFP
ncbi:hypothetical protein WJX77_009675 [Trebouxia sp. C0004]